MKYKPTLEICYWSEKQNKFTRCYGNELEIGVTDHKKDPTFFDVYLYRSEGGSIKVATFKPNCFSWLRLYDKNNKEAKKLMAEQRKTLA